MYVCSAGCHPRQVHPPIISDEPSDEHRLNGNLLNYGNLDSASYTESKANQIEFGLFYLYTSLRLLFIKCIVSYAIII